MDSLIDRKELSDALVDVIRAALTELTEQEVRGP
jgi:hypothetical protein